MIFPIALLGLSAILMAQADVNDIVSDVTNVKPLSEELYIFDVTYHSPVAELKGALESAGVTVRHSFQVLGTHQYFFVVVDDESGDLTQLTFPKGSLVTQYPVEHLSDFMEIVGAARWDVSDTAEGLNDTDLVLLSREFLLPEGSSTSQMKSMFQAYGSTFKNAAEIVHSVRYAVVGRYPPKVYIFVNLDENSLQKAVLDGLDDVGGPGNTVIKTLRLRNV